MNQKKLFNNEWKFAKTDLSVEFGDRNRWEENLMEVDLPHDWLIYNTEDYNLLIYSLINFLNSLDLFNKFSACIR